MLKHRFEVAVLKKSVSEFLLEYLEFQLQYLEFQLQYLEFSIKIQLNYAWNPLKNTEKAGHPHGKSRFAVTKIINFSAESKLC